MANICTFAMKVSGKKEGIEKFLRALTQEGDVWMGRGACGDEEWDSEDSATFYGECKWAMGAALVDNALSMAHQKSTGEGHWSWDEESQKREYVTLEQACEMYDVEIEAYSEEPGCCFAEHIQYSKDEGYFCEVADFYEYYLDEFETLEEAKEELNLDDITEEEFEGGYCRRGGFPDAF